MSRIGKRPVTLPDKVRVNVASGVVTVEGPKGRLSQAVVPRVQVAVEAGQVLVTRAGDDHASRAQHGLMRALIQNMVTGVSQGYERRLDIVGIGYKAEVSGSQLTMTLGYSHPILHPVPAGITAEVEKGTRIILRGADKQLIGETAAKLRGYRPPDSYKGKGVRYSDEVVKTKPGKSGSASK